MKPHIKCLNGKWCVWRDRSECPWGLPTVFSRIGVREALKKHFDYVNGSKGWY